MSPTTLMPGRSAANLAGPGRRCRVVGVGHGGGAERPGLHRNQAQLAHQPTDQRGRPARRRGGVRRGCGGSRRRRRTPRTTPGSCPRAARGAERRRSAGGRATRSSRISTCRSTRTSAPWSERHRILRRMCCALRGDERVFVAYLCALAKYALAFFRNVFSISSSRLRRSSSAAGRVRIIPAAARRPRAWPGIFLPNCRPWSD